MALTLKVDKIEDVPEPQRALYKPVEGGQGFQLDVSDLPDVGPALRARDHEKAEHEKTKAKLKEIQDANTAANALAEEERRKALLATGNVDGIEKSWKEKLANRETELTTAHHTEVQSLIGDVTRLTVDRDAQSIAAELAVDADSIAALLPHVRSRLAVDVREGQRVSVVLGPDGKQTGLTLKDLAKELQANKSLARLIKSSSGSGGGAGGSGGKGGGASSDAKSMTKAAFDTLSPADRMAFSVGGGTLTD